jgi:hypothetical protein
MKYDPTKLRDVLGKLQAIDTRIARLGTRADTFDESKHPRGPDGKFGSGGGGASSKSSPSETPEDAARREKADVSHLMSGAAKSRQLLNLMLVKDMEMALQSMGHSPETLENVRGMLRHHSLGTTEVGGMAKIDQPIVDAIEQNTEVGKALKDGAWLEAQAYKAWQNGAPERNAKEKASLQKEWDRGFLGAWEKEDGMSFDEWIERDYPYLNEDKPISTIFRGGELRDGVSSWSQHAGGASVGSGIRIKPDHKMTLDDALDAGGLVLGGLSRMMGSSGEAEVTMYFPKGRQQAVNVQPVVHKVWGR